VSEGAEWSRTVPLIPNAVRDRGIRLKALRDAQRITLRDVETHSRRIARVSGNNSYIVPHSSLEAIEKSGTPTPDVHRLMSLCVIYRVNFAQLLMLFDINLDDIAKFGTEIKFRRSGIVPPDEQAPDATVPFPVKFPAELDTRKTTLLSHLIESWGEIPMAFIRRLSLHEHSYGLIGTDDLTLNPYIRPGSLVQIDHRDTKIKRSGWKTDLDRPIYFLQHRNGYACGWCELTHGVLSIVPFSATQRPVKEFRFPSEIEVIGRVTVVIVALVPFSQRAGK
jgi:transcriptional regulator with XRE-family HTH domain